MNAIIEAFEAHSSLSRQALDSQKVRDGLKEVLLGPAQLYHALRSRRERSTRLNLAVSDSSAQCLQHWLKVSEINVSSIVSHVMS